VLALQNTAQLFEIINATAYALQADKPLLQKLQHTGLVVLQHNLHAAPCRPTFGLIRHSNPLHSLKLL